MAETSSASDAGDETAVVPGPTAAAPELAWSDEMEPDEPQRQPWGLAWGRAAVLALGAAAVVGVVGLIGWAVKPVHAPGVRQPTATAARPTPAARQPTVAAPAPTVTVQAPTASPQFNDGDGETSALPPTRSPAPASADDRFISWLADDGMTPDNRSLTLRQGRTTCAAFREGDPRPAILRWTQANTGLPEFAAADFVKIAVNAFCPEYVGRLVQ